MAKTDTNHKSSNGHGGERQGAGNKPRQSPVKRLNVDIDQESMRKLDQLKKQLKKPKGRLIDQAIGLLPDPSSLADKLRGKGIKRKSVAAEIRDLS